MFLHCLLFTKREYNGMQNRSDKVDHPEQFRYALEFGYRVKAQEKNTNKFPVIASITNIIVIISVFKRFVLLLWNACRNKDEYESVGLRECRGEHGHMLKI